MCRGTRSDLGELSRNVQGLRRVSVGLPFCAPGTVAVNPQSP